ncbi:MAG: hypothetical protein PHF44_04320, partial [Candidatus Pacebacteria bacterium]|nr:hypothetical protein [Candidatus Paceibacterota bacterium]
MKLKKSPKIFNNYKCDYPQNTIKRIEDGFNKLGVKIEYQTLINIEKKNISIYSGTARAFNSVFHSNGKGVSFELCRASAYAEIAERFSTRIYFVDFATYLDESPHSKELVGEPLLTSFRNFTYLKGYIGRTDFEKDLRFRESLKYITDFFPKRIA